jgi:beta-lactamase class A
MSLGFNNRSVGTQHNRNAFRIQLLAVLFILVAVSLVTWNLIQFSQQEERLPYGIIAGGIDVGGMLHTEARSIWEQTYAQSVILYYGDNPIILDPASVGFRVSWRTMLADAVGLDETEGGFWLRFFNYLTRQELQQSLNLPLHSDYQRNLLEEFLRDIGQRYDQPSGNAGHDVFTLTTFPGESGVVLNIEQAMVMIDAALRDSENRTVRLPIGDTTFSQPSLDTLRSLIIAYLDSEGFIHDGLTTIASVFILDLQTGEELTILGDVAFSAASIIKVPILIDYFRVLSRDPNQDEAWLMANSLLCSRNSSSNLLMEIIGNQNRFAGILHVTETAQYLGARNTFISAPFDEGVDGQQLGSIAVPPTSPNPNYDTKPDPYNQTTTEDMGTLFSLLYDCATYGSGLAMTSANQEFTQTECRRMLELMSANDLERLLQGGIPEGVRISHKNGWLNNTGLIGDAGIVYPSNGRNYIIAVFLWEDSEFHDYLRLWPIVEGISRATWNYFNPEDELLSPRDLPNSAQECEGNFLPPHEQVDLDNINGWRTP